MDEPESMNDCLERFARQLKAMHKTLYIATDNPAYDFSPCEIAAKMEIIAPRQMKAKWDGWQSRSEYEVMQGRINSRLAEVCQKTGAIFIPLHLAMTEGAGFPAFMEKDGIRIPLYRDALHRSFYGAQQAAPFVMPYLFPETGMKNQSHGMP